MELPVSFDIDAHLAGADLFHLASVTGEDNKERF